MLSINRYRALCVLLLTLSAVGFALSGCGKQDEPPTRKTPATVLTPPSPTESGTTAGGGPQQKTPFQFRQISSGAFHTCGIGTDGLAYCWGRNTFGQLGNRTATSRTAADTSGKSIWEIRNRVMICGNPLLRASNKMNILLAELRVIHCLGGAKWHANWWMTICGQ